MPVLTNESPGDRSPFMPGKGDGGVDLLCGTCDHPPGHRTVSVDSVQAARDAA